MKEPLYDVVIVGGGVAGLTSRAYLDRMGRKTLLLEKERKTGGLVESFTAYGVRFDGGVRGLEDSGILRPMVRELGIDVEFARHPVRISIGDDVVEFREREQGLLEYEGLLLKHFPGEGQALKGIFREVRKVLGWMDVLYGIDNPLFTEERQKDPEYLLKTLLPWLLKYRSGVRKAMRLKEPIRRHLARFTTNERLIDLICQHFFTDTPAFFALSYFAFYPEYLYPLGGTGKLTEALLGASSGEVRTGSLVTEVDLGSRRVLTAAGEAVRFRELIWAADLKSLYRAVDPGSLPSRRRRSFLKKKERVLGAKGADSVLSAYLSFEREPSVFAPLGPHLFHTPNEKGAKTATVRDWRAYGSFEGLFGWLREWLRFNTVEISVPSLKDPSLARSSRTGVIVSVLFDYAIAERIRELGFYREFKGWFEGFAVKLLEEKLGVPLEESLAGSLSSTPLTIAGRTGSSEGAITGWSFEGPAPVPRGFDRLSGAVASGLPHVHLAGQWSFSPSGVPICCVTGKLAAKRAAKGAAKGAARKVGKWTGGKR